LTVVPDVPADQQYVAGANIRVGSGHVDVAASDRDNVVTTTVHRRLAASLTIGAVLPHGSHATSVTLNGRSVAYRAVPTARGTEILVGVGAEVSTVRLRVEVG
jgi:hypothetical protein